MKEHQTVKTSQLLEVWESYSGWYWFITEYHGESIAFGLVRGHETEWGYISLRELSALGRQHRVWKVPREYWALCPCVINDAAFHFQQLKGGGEPWNKTHRCSEQMVVTAHPGRHGGNLACFA